MDLMTVISHPQALLVLAMLLILLALIAIWLLLRRTNIQEKALENRLNDVEQALTNQLQQSRDRYGEEAGRDREALSSNLKGVGDSVARVMGEMVRTQQTQMDAFALRLQEMARTDEERMGAMRSTVEERLGAYEERMDRLGGILDSKLQQNELRLESMRQALEGQIRGLQENSRSQIERIRSSMDEHLNSSLDKQLGESFQTVSERLELVYKELGAMHNLAAGMGDLKKVLTGVKSRGMLGEIQLSSLLGQLLTPEQYGKDVVLRKGCKKVDYALKLPGRENEKLSYLPVDAGSPHEAYYKLLEAQDTGSALCIEKAEAEFRKEMLKAAQRARDNFIHPPVTTDFAVIFLGTEGMYAEALRQDDMVQRLLREYQVMLTGPSTLAALLNSLQMGFHTLAIERHSRQVWELLGAVRGEFGNFAEALTRTQKRIRQAGESIESAARKSKVIQQRLKGVEKLGDSKRAALFPDGEGEQTEEIDWF